MGDSPGSGGVSSTSFHCRIFFFMSIGVTSIAVLEQSNDLAFSTCSLIESYCLCKPPIAVLEQPNFKFDLAFSTCSLIESYCLCKPSIAVLEQFNFKYDLAFSTCSLIESSCLCKPSIAVLEQLISSSAWRSRRARCSSTPMSRRST